VQIAARFSRWRDVGVGTLIARCDRQDGGVPGPAAGSGEKLLTRDRRLIIIVPGWFVSICSTSLWSRPNRVSVVVPPGVHRAGFISSGNGRGRRPRRGTGARTVPPVEHRQRYPQYLPPLWHWNIARTIFKFDGRASAALLVTRPPLVCHGARMWRVRSITRDLHVMSSFSFFSSLSLSLSLSVCSWTRALRVFCHIS